ncbi:helix-turn-helix transcriptional regulator [Pedobacter cryoconitis]|uniref:Addiction module HigA family antidote n=1 Tax=Pedobacter cryoconitis TaxID=188932 RepID=A0A327T3L3_9SPHI|nr:plasmid maintenance system antidote protein [Pedobacter cryoconitis]RAJ35711.1 addiction module HigA family antidote [Pedobacter cryoconitis]
MESMLEKYKGIHPGMILERELKKKNLKKVAFAHALNEYPQTLNQITKGKRGLTPALSLKIDKALGFEEGTMLVLQAYFEIKKEKKKSNNQLRPNISNFRKILFWDTDITKIDWEKQYRSIIRRIFERGNSQEKEEIINFYGKDKIKSVTGNISVTSGVITLLHNRKTH